MFNIDVQRDINYFTPALALDRVFPEQLRQAIRIFALVFLFISAGALILLEVVSYFPMLFPLLEGNALGARLLVAGPRFLGLFYVSSALWFILFALEAFRSTRYFRGIDYVLHESLTRKSDRGVTYEVADVLSRTKRMGGDIIAAFVNSKYGREILARCNVDEVGVKEFLAGRKGSPGDLSDLRVPVSGFLTLRDIALFVYGSDKTFSDFLFAGGTDKDNFEGALDWVFRSHYADKRRARWWARDNLSRVRSIGINWSYGKTWHLERYTRPIEAGSVFSTLSRTSGYARERIRQLESVLARAKEANVMLIGEPGVGKMDVIAALQRDIDAGTALAPLARKRIVIFDNESFVAEHGKKEAFEPELKRLLDQAERAGNIILVIENLSSFIGSAKAVGSDIVSLLDPYLTSSEFQLIATADPSSYHEVIAREPALIQRFENVQIEHADLRSTTRVLEDIAEEYESKSRLFFTYRALETIAGAADRYITEGVMPDKAVDLFVEIAPYAASKGERTVTRQVVEAYVSGKTGVPSGEVGSDERERLLNLEKILHKRVIGQNEAIETISNAMRRARAGIQNPDRPLGSFLFLGPTGVGKTETAKALAEIFSGSADKMLRLDMSEYSGDDALAQLVGSFEGGKSGVLSSKLREQPYGVLLLDEFEKTTPDVQNLFLQILDEGLFSDARGKSVNARNLIIIATSNAGSDVIWQAAEDGGDVSGAKEMIVETIIKNGEFRPELINRFDGVVLFHPLSEENLRSVADIMLEGLKERIRERGYTLVINDALVGLLVKEGYDPKFGARPMQRVVQELIEKKIANKIIEGSLSEGSSIEFSASDFA